MNTIKNPSSTAPALPPTPSSVGAIYFTVYDKDGILNVVERTELCDIEYTPKEWAIKRIKEQSYF